MPNSNLSITFEEKKIMSYDVYNQFNNIIPPPPQKKMIFFYIEINTHLKTFTSYLMIESIAVLTYFYV